MATLAICAYLCLVAIIGVVYSEYQDRKKMKKQN